MIRVGLVVPNIGDQWLGGANYFKNLLKVVDLIPKDQLQLILLAGNRSGETYLSQFPAFCVIRSSIFDRFHPLWWIRKGLYRVTRWDPLMEWVLKKSRIDVLTHSEHFPRASSVRRIGWIADFQHLHYPEFFSKQDLNARRTTSLQIATRSDAVIVSSKAALADLEIAHPFAASKASVLRFRVPLPSENEITPLCELRQRYHFDGKYLLVPNQFWIHKNHMVILEALVILNKENKRVLVIATGSTSDHRRPEHFAQLMDYVKQNKLDSEFRILGIVPPRDLAGLIRNSVALINPSLFEGWSTVAEEARSFERPVILSNIAVHLEQRSHRSCYFPPKDAQALAALIWDQWLRPQERQELNDEIRRAARERESMMAQDYYDMVMRCVGSRTAESKTSLD